MKHKRLIGFLVTILIIVVASYIGVSLYLIVNISNENDVLKQEKQGLVLKAKQLEDLLESAKVTEEKNTQSPTTKDIHIKEKELEYAKEEFINAQQYIPNFMPIAEFILTRPYMPKKNHYGIDLAGRIGEPVYAAASGMVKSVKEDDEVYGKILTINHLNGYETKYGHNSLIVVEEGDFVTKGQKIAEVGNTGISSAPHLHFEILYWEKNIDPEIKLKK
ncbi:MAG TPA: M23 family metallopeptidase [Candidatus Cloacimonetes bacterium]|nr:M23 family metallopeptidase [Candidatus Cloacimonadota bacterium]